MDNHVTLVIDLIWRYRIKQYRHIVIKVLASVRCAVCVITVCLIR